MLRPGTMIRRSWLILALLTGINLFNYLDRQVVAAVGDPMKAALSIDDEQLGLLGQAFMWSYMLTSPIFGRLGDRSSRKGLIALGVLIWSAATAASGLMHTFSQMWWARAAVGIGEASYYALGVTILDDLTPPARKGRIFAIFNSAVPIGSALGFILGGLLEARFNWRVAFFLSGAPGAFLAILVLFIQEPERQERKEHAPAVPLMAALGAISRSPRFLWTTVGFTAQTFALGGFAYWAPKYLTRVLGYPNSDANVGFGAVVVLTGLGGTALGGWLLDRGGTSSRSERALKLSALATAAAAPFAFACLLLGSPRGFFLTNAMAQLAIFFTISPISETLLSSVPASTRATAMGLSITVGHLLGDMISLWLIGRLSDRTHELGMSMMVLPIALTVNAVAWWIAARTRAETREPVAVP